MSGWNKHEEEIRGEFVQPVTCAHGSTPNCRVNMSPVIHPSCTTRHRLPQWHILNLTAVTGSSRLLRAAELWRRTHWRCRHDWQLHCLFDLWKKEWQSAFCAIRSLFVFGPASMGYRLLCANIVAFFVCLINWPVTGRKQTSAGEYEEVLFPSEDYREKLVS